MESGKACTSGSPPGSDFMNLYGSDILLTVLFTPAALLFLAALAGWGKLLICSTVAREPSGERWPRELWTGWISCTVFLQLWHLAWPIDWKTAVIAFVIGLAGWWRTRGSNTEKDNPVSPYTLVTAVLACFVFMLFVMRHARGDITVYDTGMYYYQAIRWLNEYAIVPGLANLNLQLGFNQIYFLWSSLLNIHPLWRSGFVVLNAALLTAAAFPALLTFIRWPRLPGDAVFVSLLRVMSLPVYVFFAMNFNAGNPSPDFMSWVICMVVFERSAAWMSAVHGPSGKVELPVLPLLLCVLLAMVKMSMLIFGATMFSLLFIAYLFRVHRVSIPTIMVTACAGIALGIPWLARTVVSTGYPLFPSTVAAVDVDWKVPEYKARLTSSYIQAWSRHPGDQKRDYRTRLQVEAVSLLAPGTLDSPDIQIEALTRSAPWLQGWWREMWRNPFIRMLVVVESTLLLLLAISAVMGKIRGMDSGRTDLSLLYIPPVVSLYFWIAGIPALRFGLAFMCLLLLLTAVDLVARMRLGHTVMITATRVVVAVITAGALFQGFPLRSDKWRDMALPRPVHVHMKQVQTLSGFTVLLPEKGAKSFDAPLPATTVLNPYLALRDADKGWRAGFRDETPERLWYSGF